MRPLIIVKTGATLPSLARRRGDFEDWFRAGLAVPRERLQVVDVQRGARLPDPDEVCGVVITGSAAMVSHREPWSERTGQWLVGAVERNVPVLGVCYGHQLLAQGLGGEVGPNPLGLEMGTVELTLDAEAAGDAIFGGTHGPVPVQTTHTEAVLALPPGAVRLGWTARDPNHLFRVGDRAWGVQFHPELDADLMRGYVSERRDALRADGQDPDELLASVREAPEAAAVLPRFARFCLSDGE